MTSISGTVGEDSSSATGSTSSSTTGSSSSTTGSSSSSTTASGFVVNQGITHLQVTSMVAEGDAGEGSGRRYRQPSRSPPSTSRPWAWDTIDLQEMVSNNVVEYGATVTLSDAPRKVRLGQTASVSIVTGVARNVLTVPSSAVTKRRQQQHRDRAPEWPAIRSARPGGTRRRSSTKITSGLSEGDGSVLTTGTGSSGFTFPGGGIPGGFGGGLGG